MYGRPLRARLVRCADRRGGSLTAWKSTPHYCTTYPLPTFLPYEPAQIVLNTRKTGSKSATNEKHLHSRTRDRAYGSLATAPASNTAFGTPARLIPLKVWEPGRGPGREGAHVQDCEGAGALQPRRTQGRREVNPFALRHTRAIIPAQHLYAAAAPESTTFCCRVGSLSTSSAES